MLALQVFTCTWYEGRASSLFTARTTRNPGIPHSPTCHSLTNESHPISGLHFSSPSLWEHYNLRASVNARRQLCQPQSATQCFLRPVLMSYLALRLQTSTHRWLSSRRGQTMPFIHGNSWHKAYTGAVSTAHTDTCNQELFFKHKILQGIFKMRWFGILRIASYWPFCFINLKHEGGKKYFEIGIKLYIKRNIYNFWYYLFLKEILKEKKG